MTMREKIARAIGLFALAFTVSTLFLAGLIMAVWAAGSFIAWQALPLPPLALWRLVLLFGLGVAMLSAAKGGGE